MLVNRLLIKANIGCPLRVVLKRILQSHYATAADLRISMKCFDGEQRIYTHYSDTTKSRMNVGVYLPPKYLVQKLKCPVLYFLSGRDCSYEKFMNQSGFSRIAAKLGMCIVCPDTSPRNVIDPKHPILGPGCSWYVDAKKEPWSRHYQMYTYITKELIEFTNKTFTVLPDKQSICGYSMGGFGALIAFLRNPKLYKSISVLAPAIDPIKHPIVKLALTEYIGKDQSQWKEWDPNFLAANYAGDPIEIFIDQGTVDESTGGMPENFIQSVNSKKNNKVKIVYKTREQYNHSYCYVSTFIAEHLKYHANFLDCGLIKK